MVSARFTFDLSVRVPSYSTHFCTKNNIIPNNQIIGKNHTNNNGNAGYYSRIEEENFQNSTNRRPTSPEQISGAKATPFLMAGTNVSMTGRATEQVGQTTASIATQQYKLNQENIEQQQKQRASVTVKLENDSNKKVKTSRITTSKTSSSSKTTTKDNKERISSTKGLFRFTRSKSSLSYKERKNFLDF